MTVWKWSGESRYPGALPPMIEKFRRAFSPGPTDCPWVSEDEKYAGIITNYLPWIRLPLGSRHSYQFFIRIFISYSFRATEAFALVLAWDRAPYSWNLVNLFLFGCHVIDRAYIRMRLQIVRVG